MPKKKETESRPGLSLPPPADTMVDEILRETEQRQAEARLSPQERRKLLEMRQKAETKKQKARAKAERRKPNTILLVLPEELKKQLAQIAAKQEVPQSQVAAFLLYEALDLYEAGKIRFEGYKTPTRSPRYMHNLYHPNDPRYEEDKK
jgi:hypothetical protein